jgi:hypothetical protein
MACLAGVPAAAVSAVCTRNLTDATPTDDAIPASFAGQMLPGLACASSLGPAAANAPGSVRVGDGVPFFAAVFDIAVSIATLGARARALQAADDPLGLAGVLSGGPMPASLSPLQLGVLQAIVTLSSGLQLPAPDASGITPDSKFGGQMAPWLARLNGPAVDAWAVQLLLNGVAYYNLNGTNMLELAAKLAAVPSATPSVAAAAVAGDSGGGGVPLAAIAGGTGGLLFIAAALAAAVIVLRRRRARARARLASGAQERVNPLAGVDGADALARARAGAGDGSVDGVNPLALLQDRDARAKGPGGMPQPSPALLAATLKSPAARKRVAMSARAALRLPDVGGDAGAGAGGDAGADADAAAASSRRIATALAAAPNRARETIVDRNASTRRGYSAEAAKPGAGDGAGDGAGAGAAAASEAARARREALRKSRTGSLRIAGDGSAEIAARSEQVAALALKFKPKKARSSRRLAATSTAALLPPGWASAKDKSGDTYYFTTDAMRELQVVWERPTEAAEGTLAVDATLPAGWLSALDPDDGITPYFFCAAGLVVWQRPNTPAPGFETAAAAAADVAADAADNADAPLPAGWSSTRDDSGETYYFAGETVVWERPTVAAPGAVAATDDGAAGDTGKLDEATPAAADPGALPPGWQQAHDEERTPYYFAPDGTTVWARPSAPAPGFIGFSSSPASAVGVLPLEAAAASASAPLAVASSSPLSGWSEACGADDDL